MLNSSFSRDIQKTVVASYVAPSDIANRVVAGNEAFDTGGVEHRIQAVFGEEIWLKLGRAGFTPEIFQAADVLELCAGTGFLTYHLLQRCQPKRLTVNDISRTELNQAQQFISQTHPNAQVDWILGDVQIVDFGRKFDLIIGNSFIHHFHNVPEMLSRFSGMLNEGGTFISLHEPTPLSTVVESAKVPVLPLAVLAPVFVNNIARARYKGQPSHTDLWLFEASKIQQVARQSGFSEVLTIPWGLMRPIITQQRAMHLSEVKTELTVDESRALHRAIKFDAFLNRFLPNQFFGSICLVCRV